MTRRLLLVASAVALLAGACGGSSGSGAADPATEGRTVAGASTALVPITEHAEPDLPVMVASADGREVEVNDASRIVSLSGSLSEALFTLGLGDRVVGRDISTTFDEAADIPLVTRAHDVSAESVLSLEPTLVLAETDSGPPEALEHIRDAGVPVVVFELPTSIDDIEGRTIDIAEAIGLPDEGEDLAQRTSEEIAAVQDAIPPDARRPKVAFLYMRGQAGVYLLAGEGSGADSMIAAAGGIDAGTAMGLDRPFTPLTSEALVTAAPDVILMTSTGLESVGGVDGLVEVPGIAQTPAGRDRRIITEEDGLLYAFGARTPVALRGLVEQLHHPAPVAG
jgi:iron complex transport system substrate-binding protein